MNSKGYMELLCEKLFLLGMYKMYLLNGFGSGSDDDRLAEAIKENQKEKEKTINEILDILQTFGAIDERT